MNVQRRAVLIFADALAADLACRRLPWAAGLLLQSPLTPLKDSLEADVHVFSRRADSSRDGQHWHRQRGATFAERLENAVETLRSLRYQEVVAIGRDCPQLRWSDITLAFAELSQHKLVLGPDHRGGCYLIALRTSDREILRGIRWKQNTDCAQLRQRAGETNISVLPVKQDIDSWADVRVLSTFADNISRLAAFLVRTIAEVISEVESFVDLAAHFARVRGQRPPPFGV